jgi:uncharacterized protein YyaL (SSP411 family)
LDLDHQPDNGVVFSSVEEKSTPEDMHHTFTNRLARESSPYLLQHAHNPVDWFAWGDEALAKAKAEDKVILVSIGYSACHWCHVMERESFENETTARLMNEKFVNIKIDREERPDLDHIYMDAVQAISGGGGWPLNVFLTPDAKPFFGGTYFPPVKAYNRSSWPEILDAISTAWAERRNEIEAQAQTLTDHLQNSGSFVTPLAELEPGGMLSKQDIESMFSAIMGTADKTWGGFGNAPKFPQTFTIQYLLQYHYFTGSREALSQALLSIEKMLEGGIYDHIGGGLARYSTDVEWLAPHFEKMLYDNALLTGILVDAWQITGEARYEAAIRKTIGFVTAELMSPEGGFYAALDADSEGEEGKFYVWEKAEVDELLGVDAALFCEYFDISKEGNWEEKNILRILTPLDIFVGERGLDRQSFMALLERCRLKLLVERSKRVRPALDDKIILGWNALMTRSIAKAASALDDDSYRELAEKNARFLVTRLGENGAGPAMLHTYKNGNAKFPAFLDDYAYLVSAFLQLYKTTLNDQYLKRSFECSTYLVENFSDDDSIFFFFTGKEQQDVIFRKKEIYDGATPSGNAVMAENLYQLALLFDRPEWRERADRMLKSLLPVITKYPGSFGVWASLTIQQQVGLNEVAVIGTDFASCTRKILSRFLPNLVIMASPNSTGEFPMLAAKPDTGSTQFYLCKNYTCLAPFSGVQPLLLELERTNKITL